MSTSSLRPEREEEQPSTSGKHFHDINLPQYYSDCSKLYTFIGLSTSMESTIDEYDTLRSTHYYQVMNHPVKMMRYIITYIIAFTTANQFTTL